MNWMVAPMRTTCWHDGGGKGPMSEGGSGFTSVSSRVAAGAEQLAFCTTMRCRAGRATPSRASGALVTSPSAAVMLVEPTASAATRPQVSTLATDDCEEAQVASQVTSNPEPSESIALALAPPCWPTTRRACWPYTSMRMMSIGCPGWHVGTHAEPAQSVQSGQLAMQLHASPGCEHVVFSPQA